MACGGKGEVVAGRIEGHADGHGFLVPDTGATWVFLPSEEMRDVLHGDRARVRVGAADARGRPRGEIVAFDPVPERRIVGRIERRGRDQELIPEDRRIARRFVLPAAAAESLRDGDVATIRLVRTPAGTVRSVAIEERLGRALDPGIEVEIALRKFDLPHEFDRATLRAVRALPEVGAARTSPGRVDLRSLAFVTIDGETAKDFDDAVYAEKLANGYRLLVAIADVSHYVKTGDPIDREAGRRGTSVYFPRRVIPMLPERLSNDLCSLVPDADRYALVCEMRISARGAISEPRFFTAVFRSHARLTYTQVWAFLRDGTPPAAAIDLGPRLRALEETYRRLAASRLRRGAIDFDAPEASIRFDSRGRIDAVVTEARTDAHRLIEECMLAANVSAAAFLEKQGYPALYRVHEPPAEDRVASLREFLAGLGLELGGGSSPKPKDYAVLLEAIRGRADFELLQTLLLRSLKQAVYRASNAGHFGLAYDAYLHFTSPIRRYPDLLAHRAIKACLSGEPAPELDWQALGLHCSETERRADEASRDVMQYLKCLYMADHVGETFSGRVTGVVPFGLFVMLDGVSVDGLVHVSELGHERFEFDPGRHALVGGRTGRQFRLADRIDVRVVRADAESRKIDLLPA